MKTKGKSLKSMGMTPMVARGIPPRRFEVGPPSGAGTGNGSMRKTKSKMVLPLPKAKKSSKSRDSKY